MDRHYRIGVDIGGTFTDIIVFDRRNNTIVSFLKVSSTPRRPEIAVIDTLRKMNFKKIEVETIIHATTIATNALLGQVGLELPKAALITTKGFRDIIEIGRQRRPEIYNLFFDKPKQIVPRKLRYEIDERVSVSNSYFFVFIDACESIAEIDMASAFIVSPSEGCYVGWRTPVSWESATEFRRYFLEYIDYTGCSVYDALIYVANLTGNYSWDFYGAAIDVYLKQGSLGGAD